MIYIPSFMKIYTGIEGMLTSRDAVGIATVYGLEVRGGGGVLTSAEVKKKWIYTSTPPHVFMV
jgi:hypothetical protein